MLEKQTELFKCLGDPLRCRILSALLVNNNMIVSMLVETLGESQPLISHHLRLMTLAGILVCIPCGQYRNYRINLEKVKELKELFESIEKMLLKKEDGKNEKGNNKR